MTRDRDRTQRPGAALRRVLRRTLGRLAGRGEPSLAAFTAAVAELAETVSQLPPNDPDAGPMSVDLAAAYSRLYDESADPEHLEESVRAAHLGLPLIGADHPRRGACLALAAGVLVEAGMQLDQPQLLDEAVTAGRQAAEAGHPELTNFACALRVRYEYSEDPDPADLEEAEQAARSTAEYLTGRGEPSGYEFAELAHVLRLRFAATGDAQHIRSAEAAMRESLAHTESGSRDDWFRRSLLAGVLVECHQAGDDRALDEALEQARATIQACDRVQGHRNPDYYSIYQACAAVLADWADQHQSIDVAEEAETAAHKSVQAAGADPGRRAVALETLANALGSVYALTGDIGFLDRTIEAGAEAVRAAGAAGDPGARAGYIANLGSYKQARYDALGRLADLDAAIAHAQEAIALLGPGHPDRAMYYNNLGDALAKKSARTNDDSILDLAVGAARNAVACSVPGPAMALRLSGLGSALQSHFEQRGDPDDLDQAVDAQHDALDMLPAEHPDRPGVVNNLASALDARYEHVGTREDLAAAIVLLREASAVGPRRSAQPDVLATLALLLHANFLAVGDRASLDEAVGLFEQAVQLTRPDDPALASRLSDQATVLADAAQWSPAAARAAVDAVRRALSLLPAGHSHEPSMRSNLALALCATGEDDDLEEAVTVARAAVEQTPEDSPDRARNLANLAFVLEERHAVPGLRRPRDAEEGLAALREASLVPVAAPAVRLECGQSWGRAAWRAGNVAEAARGFAAAVRQLPEVSPRRLGQSDALRRLGDRAGLAAAAAATAIADGRPDEAVALLELGRGVLLGRTLGVRGDTAGLRAADSELADRYELLREQVNALGSGLSTPSSALLEPGPDEAEDGAPAAGAPTPTGRERDRLRDATAMFEDVIERIRQLPDFADFQRQPPIEAIVAEASGGPIVIVNVSEYRCDALLLTDSGLHHVPLPDLRAEDVDRNAVGLYDAVDKTSGMDNERPVRAAGQAAVTEILDWLWKTVTRPVLGKLRELGYETGGRAGADAHADPDPESLPRLWWVPTRTLCLLPLHAATNRDTGESVLDHVISSYTPTVTALHRARSRPAPAAEARPLVITTTGPDDDARPLPEVAPEAWNAARALGVEPLDAAGLSRADLTAAIAGCSHLHIASHAAADTADPTRSHLRLADVGLSFGEIAALHAPHAHLAFLSACDTAVTSATLADEAVHLTAAFHLAGFTQVIGTQWPVQDIAAARAAQWFYADLPRAEHDPARELHRTVLELRDRYRAHPAAWAAFHHVGA